MYAALIGEDEKTASEESLLGLSSEFFMQIEWLPGGRIEEGELIFDTVFELAEETGEAGLRRCATRSAAASSSISSASTATWNTSTSAA